MIIDKIRIGNTSYDIGVDYSNVDGTPTKLSDFTNDEGFIDKNVNDLTNYTPSSQTTSQLELVLNSENYKLKGILKDSTGSTIYTSNEIDLPLESMVVSGTYDSQTKEVVLTLVNGSTIRFSVADLVSGLVSSTDLATALANYYTKTQIDTLLQAKQDTLTAGENITIEEDETTGELVISATGGSSDRVIPILYLNDWYDCYGNSNANFNATDKQMIQDYINANFDKTQDDYRYLAPFIMIEQRKSPWNEYNENQVIYVTSVFKRPNVTYFSFKGFVSRTQGADSTVTLAPLVIFSVDGYFNANNEYIVQSAFIMGNGNRSGKFVTETQLTSSYATKQYVDDSIASVDVDIDNSTITKNANDEIQTVGVIDQNTSNADKIWTGTLAQYNSLETKDSDTYYFITDDQNDNYRENVEIITSQDTSYTITNLTANKSYKLGELTTLTISACETFDEETVIYFDSGSVATVLSMPNDVVQIGDEIEADKSYIIAILNKIAVIKGYEVE